MLGCGPCLEFKNQRKLRKLLITTTTTTTASQKGIFETEILENYVILKTRY
jgi:hypothetical protein